MQVIPSHKGYPKLVLDGYYYRPHNAYRNQPKVLWYCAARNRFRCVATLRTFNREVIAVGEKHNHPPCWPGSARASPSPRMRPLNSVNSPHNLNGLNNLNLYEIFRLYGERLARNDATSKWRQWNPWWPIHVAFILSLIDVTACCSACWLVLKHFYDCSLSEVRVRCILWRISDITCTSRLHNHYYYQQVVTQSL